MDCYEYCSTCYKIETYKATYYGIVHSVGDPETWEIPEQLKGYEVKGPIERHKAGRPKKVAFHQVGNSRRKP